MKIGIFTTQFAINYGAVLQAYALRKSIEKLGHNCEIVNYKPINKVDGRKTVYSFKNIKSSIYSFLLFINVRFKKHQKQKIQKFDLFVNRYCNLSKIKYSSYNDVREKLPSYDCLVCGSDQIWNLNLFNDPTFFLQFQDIYPKANYVAYAPSIAETLTPDQLETVATYTNHFNALSIREKDSAIQLSRHLKKTVNNVLDPVFLLNSEDWLKIEEPVNVKEPFILCYALVSGKNFSETLYALKKKFKMKVVNINLAPFDKYNPSFSLSSLSPGNFVWLFRNATFVCTSSFHGTVFSILFEKQFLSIPASFRNSRMKSVLDQLSLGDRLIVDNDIINEKISLGAIDYSKTTPKLNLLKQSSLEYLNKSINGTV